jgi:hypothetical protein
VHPVIRKTWPILALIAGALLLYFELRRDAGDTAENWFWLLVGALAVILGLIDLIQRITGRSAAPEAQSDAGTEINRPLR